MEIKFFIIHVLSFNKWKYAVLILMMTSSLLVAQEGPLELTGRVKSDSILLENIHILNLSSRLGTVSNSQGEFKIPISLNDTLIFSSIQYHTIGIVVGESLIEEGYIQIELIPKIEELSEIRLKGHDLKGVFYLDASKLNDSLSAVAVEALNFSELNFSDPTNSNYIVPTANLLNLVDLLRAKKSLEVAKEEKYEREKEKAPKEIRSELGDDFFEHQLGLQKSNIESYILFCQSKDILDLYLEGRKIEVIDLLIKEISAYKNKMEIEN